MALFGFNSKKALEEVKKYFEEENYEEAALAADKIPANRLKSASEFNLLGRVYKKNGDFLQAKQMFEYAYAERSSRVVLLDLLDCCLMLKDTDSAERFFDEYHRLSPEDKVTLYSYRYKIEKKKGREHRLLISILEELKSFEYLEEYAYELAKLYHKAGMAEECMNECRDIILWFGAGATVERAKALLAYYKGELSLEDIKTAGERYVAKQKEDSEKISAMTKQQTEEAEEAEDTEETDATEEYTDGNEDSEPEESEDYCEIDEEAEDESDEDDEETDDLEENEEDEDVFEEDETEDDEPQEEEGEGELEEIEEEELPIDQLPDSLFDEDSEELPVLDLSGLDLPEEEVIDENTREEKELFEPYYKIPEIENAKLRKLLKEKKVSMLEELKNFERIEQVHKQLIKSLELTMADRDKSYFVITGEKKTGKTTLACGWIRLLYRLGIVKYDRTATIHAAQLNQLSPNDYKGQLKNCNLIIENAGGMTQETLDAVLDIFKGQRGKTCLILEDNTRSINKFLRTREGLNILFNNRIHLGKYSANDLLGFACDYIEKEDYGIDKMAAEVLGKKIDEIVRSATDDKRLQNTLKAAADAISCAEKRYGEILLKMAAEGNFQPGNFLVIIAEDVVL